MKDYILNAMVLRYGGLAKVFCSFDRAKEIESLDKLSKKIGIAAIDIDAFLVLWLKWGTKEAAQSRFNCNGKCIY